MKLFRPYLPAFGLNKERSGVSIFIQPECVKVWTRITLNTDTFHAVAEDTEYSMIYLRIDKYNHKQNLKTTKTATLVIDVNKRFIGGSSVVMHLPFKSVVWKMIHSTDTFNTFVRVKQLMRSLLSRSLLKTLLLPRHQRMYLVTVYLNTIRTQIIQCHSMFLRFQRRSFTIEVPETRLSHSYSKSWQQGL